jgi:hypothetical protein
MDGSAFSSARTREGKRMIPLPKCRIIRHNSRKRLAAAVEAYYEVSVTYLLSMAFNHCLNDVSRCRSVLPFFQTHVT